MVCMLFVDAVHAFLTPCFFYFKGLVYIKCASPEVAGRVYEAIHANYFDSTSFVRYSNKLLESPVVGFLFAV